MDIVLGIKVKDSVLLASSKAVTRGISVLNDSDDKTRALSEHCLMSFTGEAGDTIQFADFKRGVNRFLRGRQRACHTPGVTGVHRPR